MQRRLFLAALLLPGLAACGRRRPATPELITVFFTASSSFLDDPARYTIAQAAEVARLRPNVPVRILGFAAPGSGVSSVEFTRNLATARAIAVRDALIAAGVERTRVTLGERSTVSFEQIATESRRVEIVFGR